jgi:hypothetical protein
MFKPRSLAELAADWPPELDHISASSVKMIARCPEQWRRRYVLGQKTAPAAALIAGTADHAAIEKSMRQKITTHIDLPADEVVDEFFDRFESEVEFAGGWKEVEVKSRGELVKGKVAKTKVLDSLKVEGGKLVEAYHLDISPKVQPIAVEEEFSFTAPNLPVRVDGRIDLIATKEESKEYLIDRKRSGRMKYRPDPEWIIQAEVYQLVKHVPHAWHISVPGGGGPQGSGGLLYEGNAPELIMSPRNRKIAETQLEHLAGEIGYFFMRYGPDNPWPARGKMHVWACSYCGFRPDCWAWR